MITNIRVLHLFVNGRVIIGTQIMILIRSHSLLIWLWIRLFPRWVHFLMPPIRFALFVHLFFFRLNHPGGRLMNDACEPSHRPTQMQQTNGEFCKQQL